MTSRPTMSIEQQAAMIGDLAGRCALRDGAIAGETYVLLTKSDAEKLLHLASRLERMAPHENAIREMVMR